MPTPRPDATWQTAAGVTLDLLALPDRHPDLLAWWWPLHRAARWAWWVKLPWPLHLEEFQVIGVVPRRNRPDVWVYLHRGTGRELFVDGDGATYRLLPLQTTPPSSRLVPCPILAAAHEAHLHLQPAMEPGPFDPRHGVAAWLTPRPTRARLRLLGAPPSPSAADPPEIDAPVIELPLLGPYGESACLDPACAWCRDRAHERDDWCEDPSCARCNGGPDLATYEPELDLGLASESRPEPEETATDAEGGELVAADQLQAQRERRAQRQHPPSETGS